MNEQLREDFQHRAERVADDLQDGKACAIVAELQDMPFGEIRRILQSAYSMQRHDGKRLTITTDDGSSRLTERTGISGWTPHLAEVLSELWAQTPKSAYEAAVDKHTGKVTQYCKDK